MFGTFRAVFAPRDRITCWPYKQGFPTKTPGVETRGWTDKIPGFSFAAYRFDSPALKDWELELGSQIHTW